MTRDKIRNYLYGFIAIEISRISRYFDECIQLNKLPADDSLLFSKVDTPQKSQSEIDGIKASQDDAPLGRRLLLLNGNLNYDLDVQGTLLKLNNKLSRFDRVACVIYNSYFRWIYQVANFFRLRRGPQPDVFITRSHIQTLATISGFELVRTRPAAYFPFRLFGIGSAINLCFAAIPGLRWLSFTSVILLRPKPEKKISPKLSIVIPARNEKGNIESAITRLKDFLDSHPTEIIFVEGHSSDDTWGEINRVSEKYKDQYEISSYQQPGKGKADAVRLGFAKANGEVLTILDADLTMPPELLHRFYDSYCIGTADFINGSRLVYPMEDDSMRFLNRLGNIFFAKALSFVLDTTLTDSLCGTKLLSKRDYDRFISWRNDFGDFDPFGDFELLFPAASMGLGMIDIPIRYKSRVYGSTNISRFRHGLVLLKMTLTGLTKIKVCTENKGEAMTGATLELKKEST